MRQEPDWTPERVAIRFREAAQTLTCLPGVIAHGYFCSWPPILRDYLELYFDSDPVARRSAATPKAVTEMDEALEWLRGLPEEERKIVWMRACGAGWRTIAESVHKDRNTVRRHWLSALSKIALRLNYPRPFQAKAPL